MLTQTPRSPSSSGSLSTIAAAASRSTLKVPIRLTLIDVVEDLEVVRPALAGQCAGPSRCRRSRRRSAGRPRRPRPRSTAACDRLGLGDVRRDEAGASPSSAASASPFSALRSAIDDLAPRRQCSRRAVAAPSPEAPPATSAPAPSIFIGAQRTATSQLPVTAAPM